jgi:hypothetical protein
MTIDDELAALEGQHALVHGLLDQVDAYRSAAIARGYSEHMAEVMACVQYHWVLMQELNRTYEGVHAARAALFAKAIAKARETAAESGDDK